MIKQPLQDSDSANAKRRQYTETRSGWWPSSWDRGAWDEMVHVSVHTLLRPTGMLAVLPCLHSVLTSVWAVLICRKYQFSLPSISYRDPEMIERRLKIQFTR